MNRGYVKLYRKSLDSGWLKKPKPWVFWTYCLLKATHKPRVARVGNQEIALHPGQFIFGRRVAAEETGLTHREIRTCLDLLGKWQNLTIKTTNKFSIITIVNWPTYQGDEDRNDQLNDQVPTSKRPQTRMKECKNKKSPDEISSEITALQEKYSPDLLSQVFQAIASTRKSNRITDSITLKVLQDWQKYPVHQVEAGIRLYLEKDCAARGKGEKYLLGIIRNQNGEPGQGVSGESDCKVRKTTGSPAYDDHLRSQGYRIIP